MPTVAGGHSSLMRMPDTYGMENLCRCQIPMAYPVLRNWKHNPKTMADQWKDTFRSTSAYTWSAWIQFDQNHMVARK